MKNRLGHIFIQFLIVTLAGLGGVQAGSLCSADCVLCEAPGPVSAVSCCDDMLSPDQDDMVSVKSSAGSSSAGCDHGEFCSVIDYPLDAGINSSNLFDDFVLHKTPAVSYERLPVIYLKADVVLHPPPDHVFPPLYTRNCSYLI